MSNETTAPRPPTEEEQEAATGDCFPSAAIEAIAAVLAAPPHLRETLVHSEKLVIAHGMVTDKVGNIRHQHAWVEAQTSPTETICINTATGNRGVFPKPLYYKFGDITPKETRLYSVRQYMMAALLVENWGPFDDLDMDAVVIASQSESPDNEDMLAVFAGLIVEELAESIREEMRGETGP